VVSRHGRACPRVILYHMRVYYYIARGSLSEVERANYSDIVLLLLL